MLRGMARWSLDTPPIFIPVATHPCAYPARRSSVQNLEQNQVANTSNLFLLLYSYVSN